MAKAKGMPLGEFLKRFSTDEQCQEYLASRRWQAGFVCPKCGCIHGHRLSNGLYQCAQYRHQTSVTVGTILHRSHCRSLHGLWFDRWGISAVQLARQLGVTYNILPGICSSESARLWGQRGSAHRLSGVIEFDDAYFSGPTIGRKRGRGTDKAKVFVALSLDNRNNPRYLKIRVTDNIKRVSVNKFAHSAFKGNSTIHSDGYRSYIPALKDYNHQHKLYDPDSGMLHWLNIIISNVKAFILGTYHGLSKIYLQSYLDEYCFRFCRRNFGAAILECLTVAVSCSASAYSKG